MTKIQNRSGLAKIVFTTPPFPFLYKRCTKVNSFIRVKSCRVVELKNFGNYNFLEFHSEIDGRGDTGGFKTDEFKFASN